jgi:hypothetical protein
MKILSKVVSVSTLSLFLGVSGWMLAQEQHEEAKPNDESRPAASKPAHDEKAKPAHEDKRGDNAKPQEQHETGKVPEQTEDKAMRQENTKRGDRNEHSSQTQMQAQGGDHRGGGRIPEDKFRSNFGRQHTFKVSRPTVVGGQPQFQYGGYAFNIIGAWPVDWSYDDAVYVDYINGEYFLFDLAHSGVSVAIVVVM